MKNNKTIDLHIHTSFSDGSFTPNEIIESAIEKNLSAISITDHDNVAGCVKVLENSPQKIKFLTGIEISTAPPSSFSKIESLHILGYGIDVKHKEIENLIKEQEEKRLERNDKIFLKLQKLGFDININEIKRDKNMVGRPHIAEEMVNKNYAKDVDDAFKRFLSKGKMGYVKKEHISFDKVLWTIKKAGGISSLAHPFFLKLSMERVNTLITILKSEGLNGIEVYYPNVKKKVLLAYQRVAEKHELLKTGGSDFHGEYKKNIDLGDANVPFEVYENIMNALKCSK